MRIAFIVVAGMLVFLVLWHGVDAQDEASSPCWEVVHGPIGDQTMRASSSTRGLAGGYADSDSLAPETWEAILVNQCTGSTWKRDGYRAAWEPVGR